MGAAKAHDTAKTTWDDEIRFNTTTQVDDEEGGIHQVLTTTRG